MSTHAMFWVILLLGFVALFTFQLPGVGTRLIDPCRGLVMADCGQRKDMSDFDFGKGTTVKCGVAGVSTSCGSVKQ